MIDVGYRVIGAGAMGMAFYIGRTAIDAAPAYMNGPYEFVELDAGHWLVQEQPDGVERLILGHLEGNR